MSSSSIVSSIRIVSLPMEFQTHDGVVDLVENVLRLGGVASVRIAENFTNANVRYSSAFIDFEFEADSENAVAVFPKLEEDGSSNVLLDCGMPIHWTNGKPMGHIAVRRAAIGSGSQLKSTADIARMPLEVDSWMSIYIPMIPDNMLVSNGNGFTSFKTSDLQICIEQKLRLGKVKRVDFVTRQQDDKNIQSAFVHFEHWFDLPYATKVRDAMNADGVYRQKGYLDNGAFNAFVAFGDNGPVPRYLTFKINHKPIADATPEMNLEQYVAANALMSKAIEDKDKKIAELQAEIDKMRSTVDGKGEMTVAELM